MNDTLRVGFAVFAPYLYPCVFEDLSTCGNKPGINYEVVRILAKELIGYKNLSLVKSPHFKKKGNSSNPAEWQGLLGMLARDEIDVSGSFMYFDNPDELRAGDFALPVAIVQRGMVMKATGLGLEHQQTNIINDTFFHPFQSTVWLFIFLSALSVITMRICLHFFVPKSILSKSASKAVLALFVAIKVFILLRMFKARYYKGKIIKYKPILPFPSLEAYVNAMEAGTARFLDTSYLTSGLIYVNNSDSPLLMRLRKSFEHNPIKTIKSNEKRMNLIDRHRKKYILFTSEIYFKFLSSQYCDLTFVPLETGKRYLGMVFRKNSGLMQKFVSMMYRYEYSINDIYEHVVRKYLPPKYCDFIPKTSEMSKKPNPFHIREFFAPLLIWFLVLMCCIVVLFIESVIASFV